MTVVIPSSHSPMSSIEHPSAPRTPSPVAEVPEVNDDNRGLSSDDEGFRTFSNFHHSPLKPSIARPTNRKAIETHEAVRDNSICNDFLGQHLRTAPATFTLTDDMNEYLDGIRKAGTVEWKMYKPAASLLTAISKEVYSTFWLIVVDIGHRFTAENYRVSR